MGEVEILCAFRIWLRFHSQGFRMFPHETEGGERFERWGVYMGGNPDLCYVLLELILLVITTVRRWSVAASEQRIPTDISMQLQALRLPHGVPLFTEEVSQEPQNHRLGESDAQYPCPPHLKSCGSRICSGPRATPCMYS